MAKIEWHKRIGGAAETQGDMLGYYEIDDDPRIIDSGTTKVSWVRGGGWQWSVAALPYGFCDSKENAMVAAQCCVDRINDTGRTLDRAVYYRNLAILLGATPISMQDNYDRWLCEERVVKEEHVNTAEIKDMWEEVDRLTAERDHFKAMLRERAEELLIAREEVEALRKLLKTQGEPSGDQ